ncbi:MAG TPA: M12 family metallo-peptidase, partial [Gaiellaceae bacterium]|nr:M12 family metallo-peptidase [Gaiellaceae bacterium]
MKAGKDSGTPLRVRSLAAVVGLCAAGAVLTISFGAGAASGHPPLRDVHNSKAFWHRTALKSVRVKPTVRLRSSVRPFALKRASLHRVLAPAPWENTRAARTRPVVISLPAPNGRFERFALYRTAIMAPGLQRKHPEIATYGGYGVDDPAASIVADLSPIGFHASVRSPHGGWLIDPYYRKNPNVYVSYAFHQEKDSFAFTEHGVLGKSPINVSDRTPSVPTGDVLRTYRLALITDPGYAAYVGGPANVTAAKVALINRVDQPYHDDLSIRMQLIANNDLLNLNDWAAATAPNGPCGAAACFTQSQVTGCSSTTRARFVIGQIIGASNYDIGHLALGQPGGGVANLGVVGRSNKAGGCTGIPTPVGDFYAIDYVAHEMGHQYSGNHPFNGNQLNCSSGNRNAGTSVEPGSGSSIMAYAGICLTDDLQRHSDPYFSERSQTEISTYTSSAQAAINEVQTASLRHFGGGNEVQTATFGPGYAPSATIQPLTVAIGAAPSSTQMGGLTEDGNTVTVATGSTGATHTLQTGDVVTISGAGNAGYNGTWTVTSVPSSRSFTYTNPTSGLPRTGGGTITLAVPGATESGTTVTLSTAAAHGRSVGDIVTVSGVGVSGYNGTFTVTAVPSARTLQYTAAASGLANSGGGSVVYDSPFQIRYNGADSAVIGGSALAYSNANIQAAINAIPGFPGGAVVTGAASTGFTVTFSGTGTAGTDVAPLSFDNLSCGGCFGSIEETNHGGAFDSFTLNYNGNVSAPIVNGTNFTAAAIQTALQGVSEVQNVALTGYTADGNSYTLNYNGNDTIPITRGQNNTAAGIQAAIQGGNEQQAVTLGSFNGTTQSFQIQYGGNTSVVLGSGGLAVSNANIVAAMAPLLPAGGTVSSAGAGNTGFTVTFGGTLASTDVASISIVNCTAPCTSSVRETVKGTTGVAGWIANTTVSIGTVADTGYTVTFNGLGDVSQLSVTNGTGGTSGTVSTTTPGTSGILPSGATATVAGFGGGTFNNTGFQVTYGGTLALTNVPVLLGVQDFTAGASGFVGETDKGGAVDNQGTTSSTGNSIPSVSAPSGFTIPLRTPFALTGSATDADGDPLVYSWEQDDRGGANGTALLNNTKVDGPLFAMFPQSGQISDSDSLLYNSPGENHLTSDPTRVFPDLQQILDNNTNADTGSCPTGPIAPPVTQAVTECYSEFLPTADYLGSSLAGNASPPRLDMRFTARDGKGGSNFANTTLALAPGTGPFLVTSNPSSVSGAAQMAVTWNVAGTDANGINTSNVKISLSTDGGHTFPTVLAASTPNDGSQSVTLPNIATTHARIKVEAIGNVFFDLNNSDITIVQDTTPPVTTASLSPPIHSGWYASPTLTLSADDGSGSGIASTVYSLDGGPSTTYSGPISGFTTGNHFVQYHSVDNAGNIEATKLIAFKVDAEPPTVTITNPKAGAVIKLHKHVKANFKCAEQNKKHGSGLDTCVGTVPKG